MERLLVPKRDNFKEIHDKLGFDYSVNDNGEDYWNEGVAYNFSKKEFDKIGFYTKALHDVCIEVVDNIISDPSKLEEYGYPSWFNEMIIDSWDKDHFQLYGRFDFGYDNNKIYVFEYNADTPTCLLESSLVQEEWSDKVLKSNNTIREKLIEEFAFLAESENMIHFLFSETSLEDFRTVELLAELAREAGLEVFIEPIDKVGNDGRYLYDSLKRRITCAFKLYPWEWLIKEEAASVLPTCGVRWINPPWTILMSDKLFLTYLYTEDENDDEGLLYTTKNPKTGSRLKAFLAKPRHGREGVGIHLYSDKMTYENCIFQEKVDLPKFDKNKTITIGSWVIGGEFAGICCREQEDSDIITNRSKFVPYFIKG